MIFSKNQIRTNEDDARIPFDCIGEDDGEITLLYRKLPSYKIDGAIEKTCTFFHSLKNQPKNVDLIRLIQDREVIAFMRDAKDSVKGELIEFNVPASVIMLLDAIQYAPDNVPIDDELRAIRDEGEMGMIQLALLNMGINANSVFITQKHRQGWRYRNGKFTKTPVIQVPYEPVEKP